MRGSAAILARALGVPLVLHAARGPGRGRAALRRVWRALGRRGDAAACAFPHPEVSLSHSGDRSVAVGVAGGRGVGVDVERRRTVDPRVARLYLRPAELRWLASLAPRVAARARLRLWTVKEACFKADRANARTWLADYGCADPSAVAGRARRGRRAFRYATAPWRGGFCTVAVAR